MTAGTATTAETATTAKAASTHKAMHAATVALSWHVILLGINRAAYHVSKTRDAIALIPFPPREQLLARFPKRAAITCAPQARSCPCAMSCMGGHKRAIFAGYCFNE